MVFRKLSDRALSSQRPYFPWTTPGLIPRRFDVMNEKNPGPLRSFASLAAGGDSFYEYPLKDVLLQDSNGMSEGVDKSVRNRQVKFDMFYRVVSEALPTLSQGTRHASWTMSENDRGKHKFEALTCFAPGMLSLA